MTTNILKDRVEQQDLIDLPDWQVSEILNSPDTSLPIIIEYKETSIGYGSILEVLGAEEGAEFLDSLENLSTTVPIIKWAMQIIDKSLLDLSSSITRTQLQTIVDPPLNLLTQSQVDAIIALSKRERYPSWAEYNQIEVTAKAVGLARGGVE